MASTRPSNSGSSKDGGSRAASGQGRVAEGSASGLERRNAQREALRQQRMAEIRRQKRIRRIVIAVIVVVALAVVGGIGWAIYRATRPAGPVVPPTGIAAEQTYYEFGAPAGSGAPVVDIYLDFMCPICGSFHQVNGEDVDAMVTEQTATVRLHTRNFLDGYSTTGDYSTRAAGAFAAVYSQSPEKAWAYQDLLFQNQPQEKTPGLTNTQLADLAEQAGAEKAPVETALREKTYVSWIDQLDAQASKDAPNGTPTILVDGEPFGDAWQQAGALKQAVAAASTTAPSDGGGASDGGS